jgi:hypothetical protein
MNNIELLDKLGFNGKSDKSDKSDDNDDVNDKEVISSFDKILFQSMKQISKGHFCVFGSKPFRYMNGDGIKLRSDCDIICDKEFYILFQDLLKEKTIVKLFEEVENSSFENEISKSLLKFSCINNFVSLKIKLENDVSYIIDCVVVNNLFKMAQPFVSTIMGNIVTKYSQNLISTKTLVYELTDDLNFIPMYSHNLVKSLYQPDYYQPSIYAIMYIMKLYLKVFNEYGLDNDGYQICSRKYVKRKVEKLNGPMWRFKNKVNEKKYLLNIENKDCEKILFTMIENKISWLTFDTSIIYRFMFFDELIRFPMSNDLEYYLKNLNMIPKLNCYGDLLKRWFSLLRRIYGSSVIDCFNFDYMNCNDEYTLIEEIKKLTTSLRISFKKYSDDLVCPLCLEQIVGTSPIHLCNNGHCSHLNCIIEQEKKLLVDILTSLNFDREYGDSVDDFCKYHCSCGICRDDNMDLKCNFTKGSNPMLHGAFRSKEYNKIDSDPKDLFIDKYTKLSVNISHCNLTTNFSDYFLGKIRYLKLLNSKKII